MERREETPRGEKQTNAAVDRRQFIYKCLTGAGAILFTGGLVKTGVDVKGFIQADNETRRELKEEGVTKPDQSALETAKKIRTESAEHTLNNRTQQELWKSTATVAQQESYNRELGQRRFEKFGKDVPRKFSIDLGAIVAGGGLTAGGAASLAREHNRRVLHRTLL